MKRVNILAALSLLLSFESVTYLQESHEAAGIQSSELFLMQHACLLNILYQQLLLCEYTQQKPVRQENHTEDPISTKHGKLTCDSHSDSGDLFFPIVFLSVRPLVLICHLTKTYRAHEDTGQTSKVKQLFVFP